MRASAVTTPAAATPGNAAERAQPEAFRDWRLTQGVSAATTNKSTRTAKAAWSWGVRIGIATANPWKGVRMVKTPQIDPRNLTDIEARKILEAARGSWLLPIVATALYGGLRFAELIALAWPDVDLEGGSIRVRNTATFRTKSRKPRTVPLAAELRGILEPLKKPLGLCFPDPEQAPDGSPRPLSEHTLRHAVERHAVRSGVAFTLHDLRRTFASMLAARGVPTTRIRDYLGHASIATTEGYYVARGSIDPADVAGLRFGIAIAPTAAGAA
jgi:integrase